MPRTINGVILFTRADLRRRPGRGPALKLVKPDRWRDRQPLRSLSGRYLYIVHPPPAVPPAPQRPAPLRWQTEVG